MRRLGVFFVVSIVICKCSGGLLGDFLSSAHNVAHGVAGTVLGGISHGAGIKFEAGGQINSAVHRPSYGHRPDASPVEQDTTIIVIKEEQDGPPHRPHGPPHKPHRPPHRPHYNQPNGPGFNQRPDYQQQPVENNNYNNQGSYGQQHLPNNGPYYQNNNAPNNKYGRPNQNEYNQNQNGYVPNNQNEYNNNNPNYRPNQGGQIQPNNNNYIPNQNFNQNNYQTTENNNQYQSNNNPNYNNNADSARPISNNQNQQLNPVNTAPENTGNFDLGEIFTSSTENNKLYTETTTTRKPNKNSDDDKPFFVPLSPNQYVYGGDKIQVNAPKRETSDKPKPNNDYDDLNLDIRSGDN